MTPMLVLTTVGTNFDAEKLASQLIEKRLAACVNILPQMQSVYRWQGSVQNDSEKLLLIKTADDRLDALRQSLLALHPYEVPEFVVIRIDDIAPAYRSWLIDSVS